MRKVSAIILVLVLLLSCFAGCGKKTETPTTASTTVATEPPTEQSTEPTTEEPTQEPTEEITEPAAVPEDIVILYTNDVHTYIDNPLSYDVIAFVKQELAGIYGDNVLLVDAGDHIQGTAYGSMDKGATIIEMMNAAGYDLATLGNHEFDYGMDGCIAIRELAEFPYVSCNFYNEENGERGENVLNAYEMYEFGGTKLAIVGVTTPESFTKSTPAYFQDEEGNYIYGISGGEDGTALYEDLQFAINSAISEGADYRRNQRIKCLYRWPFSFCYARYDRT